MSGLWFEEFEDGMVFNHEWSRTITDRIICGSRY